MVGVLRELRQACESGIEEDVYGSTEYPLIIAGDLFDTPKPSPGLINLAWQILPAQVYAVAGQHDLPNHSMEELDESGLGLLVGAKRVTLLDRYPVEVGPVQLVGLSWKQSPMAVHEFRPEADYGPVVAVIHRYCWVEGHSFPGCPQEEHVSVQSADLKKKGYTSAVWGDNHRNHWSPADDKGICWYNSGIMIPRNADFNDYAPTFAYLMSDGTFDVQLSGVEHKWQPWVSEDESRKAGHKVMEFVDEIVKMVGSDTKERFLDEIESAMSNIQDEGVRKQVWAILQKAQEVLGK